MALALCLRVQKKLGATLRAWLIEVAAAKRAAEGSGQKMQLLYDYMTGTETHVMGQDVE